MSTEANKAVDRRYIDEVLNQGNLAAVDEICASNYVAHVPGSPPQDRETNKAFIAMFRTAFPDLHVTLEDHIAEGDKVVQRGVFRGTHKGEFQGIPPTGKQVSFTAININRIAGGQLVESWGVLDSLSMMQQLGVIPAPGSGGS